MAFLIISLDANNPLHLHVNDSNGTPLISIKLTGVENYRVWASAIKLTIQTKNKMGFINGTCLRSDYVASNLLIDQWDRAELINHGKLMKLMQFLMGLDDVYQPIRSSLLTKEILPKDKDAFAIVVREESHRGIPPTSVKTEKPQASVLNNNVVLFDVLVILEYCVSLLYVHELIKDSKLSVSFDETTCFIREMKRERILGTGSESAGLDVFDANCDKFDVSNQKTAFPSLSEHKYVCLGELVHLDVWGPYKVVSREGFRYFLTVVDDFSRLPSLVYGREPNLSHLRSFGCALLLSLKAKAHSSSHNNDEEGPFGRDGNVHQPVIDFKNQPGHDDQHIATPIGAETFLGAMYANHYLLSGDNYCFISNLNKSIKPSSFEEASKDINWVNAMNEDMHALYENDTWVLCDLPAAPRQWNHKLSEALREVGFVQSKNDHSLFVKNAASVYLYLLVYVDDVITSTNEKEIENFKQFLKNKFKIKDLGELKYFLGIEHMHSPLKSHLDIAMRVLKYLKLAPGYGIQFSKRDSDFDIAAFSDSDWVKCPVTRRSISDYCVFVNGCLVSWKSKKQSTLSRSSAEAAYRSMASTTCEIMWIVKVMKDLNVENLIPANLYCDNKLAIQIATNPVMHEKTTF
ncbi:ribonuclease H-like domain-containing protein [Tanacetum coccineum]